MSNLLSIGGAGNPAGTGFYDHLLDQSLKFDDGKTQYLTRTPASASNQKTWTWSSWVKLGRISGDMGWLWGAQGQTAIYISDGTNTSLRVNGVGGGDTATTLRLRDPSAWYHFVVAVDTTDSTAGDRLKIYVNGVRQTAFDFNTNPTLNADTNVNSTNTHIIGYRSFSSDQAFDGYLAEVNFIDGAALTPSSFGETKDGIWIPKDTSGLTFGTNGFHLTFKDDVVSEGFNTVTYTGTAGTQSISGLGFEPDFVWIKNRGDSRINVLQDSVRGSFKYIHSNSTSGENTTSGNDWFRSFDGDGFTVSSATTGGSATPEWNASGNTYVGWCWEAGGTPTADNSAGAGATPTAGSVKIDGSNLGSALAGTIPATKISANTARGFSIVGYEATGSAGTIAHGLSAAPEFIIVKHRDQSGTSWPVYYGDNTDAMYLNSNGATSDDANAWNDTTPTSTVFSVGANGGDTNNSSGGSTIAYCFHSVSGYSKFGSYSGTGSSGNAITGLGFKPAFLMIKRTDNTGAWAMFDNMRGNGPGPGNNGGTSVVEYLQADKSNAEGTSSTVSMSFDSDGFTVGTSNTDSNASGGTYIYMAFADTREAAFFKDVTTNGNHWTPSGLDYRDSVPDVPTNNFATLNGLDNDSMTLSNGNLTGISPANAHNGVGCTFGVTGGKWYWEVLTGTGNNYFFGMAKSTFQFISQYTNDAYNFSDIWAIATDGQKFGNGSGESSYGSSFSSGDILQLAFDLDNGKFYAGKNGTYFNSGDPAGGTNAAFTNVPTGESMQPFYGSSTSGASHTFNFGQDSSFDGLKATSNANADANGHGSFAYAPPSGFLSICSQNLPDVAIIDGTENFNTVLYTGNGSSRSITGVGFRPDWIWFKARSGAIAHLLYDSVRGATKYLQSNSDSAEGTESNSQTSFDSDGFSLGTDSTTGVNQNSTTYVAWNWKINGGSTSNVSAGGSSNIRLIGGGTADQAAVQVNTAAGISIVSFENTVRAADGFCTFPHGLGSAPDMVWLKSRTSSNYWAIYHSALGLKLGFLGNSLGTNAFISSTFWNAVSSSTVKFQSNGNLAATDEDIIAYCFKNIEGYSKAGSYVGNGSTDGTFVHTGFAVSWVLIKWSNGSQDWTVFDNKRPGFNETDKYLHPSAAAAEGDYDTLEVDLLSNGFKCRGPYNHINTSGGNYIYLAFAESPFKFANAR